MKNLIKRFKLSEWLLISQVILSIATLFLTTYLGDTIIDLVGLIGNIINGVALMLVFFFENSRNVKYYELTGQFIFNKLNDSFSSFMDFLMSDEYKKRPFNEHNVLHDKLIEMAQSNDYDAKRKISRALPYLFDLDKKMTMEIVSILRKDVYKGRTDIRRRTIEALITILQKQAKHKKQKKLASKFLKHFTYCDLDDSYTLVACIEGCYFLFDYVFDNLKDKNKCKDVFNSLKADAYRAFIAGWGYVEECIVSDMDNIWNVLSALSGLQNIRIENYIQNKNFIENILVSGQKFSKLVVVKNLYYTCEGFPECLSGQSCTVNTSKYMLDKINSFLTNAIDKDIFLAMPTVRYFDCVCNNICNCGARETAKSIMREYFLSDELLITQTAFDKFAKLLNEDKDFAKEILTDLLKEEQEILHNQSNNIVNIISQLPETKKSYFSIVQSRLKFKSSLENSHSARSLANSDEQIKEVNDLINNYNERVKFIGKIKKFKEDHKL